MNGNILPKGISQSSLQFVLVCLSPGSDVHFFKPLTDVNGFEESQGMFKVLEFSSDLFVAIRTGSMFRPFVIPETGGVFLQEQILPGFL